MSQKESGTVDYFTDSVVLPKASGKGIKIGYWDETDEDTASFGWRDITGQVTVRGVGGSSPTWSQIASGPFRAYQFAVNDECWFVYHIPHDIVPGADIHFHTHFIGDGTDTNPVKWQYTYAYALGYGQAVFDMGTGTTVTSETAPTGDIYEHMISETAAVTVSGLTEPDGLIYAHIKRITNGAVDNTDGIFLLTADIHYQSTGVATIGRTATEGFYS